MYSSWATWIAFPVNDITVDENAWTLGPTFQWLFPEETVLLNSLNLPPSPPSPCRLFPQQDPGMGPVWQASQAAWVLRQRPLIQWCFQSRMKEQWGAHTQVHILVEQLSYAKIFGGSRAQTPQQHAPLHQAPSSGCVCEYMDDFCQIECVCSFLIFCLLGGMYGKFTRFNCAPERTEICIHQEQDLWVLLTTGIYTFNE